MKGPAKVFEEVADALVQSGVHCIFGLMGEDNAPLVVACVAMGIRYHPVRHENIAVAAADGFFRATGSPGVALVTGGPGLTNCLTALNTAHRARSSVLLLCGGGRQQEDAREPSMVREVDRTAWLKHFSTSTVLQTAGIRCFKPDSAEGAVTATFEAVAESRYGTAVLLLSGQLLKSQGAGAVPLAQHPEPAPLAPPADVVESIADLLQETWAVRRPLILAGLGSVRSDAGRVLARLGELTGALLATTMPAKGFFHFDKYAIGVCGTYSTPVASDLITQADCVLCFGAGLNKFTTYNNSLFPKAHIIQVDSDERALGLFMDTTVSVRADVRLTAEALVKELETRGHHSIGFRTRETQDALAGYSKQDGIRDKSTPTHVDTRTLVLALDRLLPADRIVCLDSGHQARFANALMGVTSVRNFMQPGEAGAMGLGLGGAIGAQIGRPHDLVACFAGDGALAMALGDLETTVRLKLPMLIVVMNDEGFGAEVNYLVDMGLPTELARIPAPSFSDIAVAMGAAGATVRGIGDLGVVTRWLDEGRPGPLVLDCRVNPEIRAGG